MSEYPGVKQNVKDSSSSTSLNDKNGEESTTRYGANRLFEKVEKIGDKFHAHLDECAQCRNNPFNLCSVGHDLLISIHIDGKLLL